MPTYDYRCNACGHAFELFQSMTAKHEKTCPKCGKKALERLIGTGAAVLFKGSGFYQTDYRSEGYKKAADADKPASDTAKSDAKPENKSETKDVAAAAKSEAKPDTRSDTKPEPKPESNSDTASKLGTKSDSKPGSGDAKSYAAKSSSRPKPVTKPTKPTKPRRSPKSK